MSLPISKIAFHHTDDVDVTARADANHLTELGHICIVRAEAALDCATGTYTDLQRHKLQSMFQRDAVDASQHQELAFPGADNAASIDALALARQQLEGYTRSA